MLKKKFRFAIRALLIVTACMATALGGHEFMSRRHAAQVDLGKLRHFEHHVRQLADQTNVPVLRVAASDTGQPVANVLVAMTQIGPDGGDGAPTPRKDQATWIPVRPIEVTVSKEGTAKILDDHSVRLEGDVRWQAASLQFEFDQPANVEEIRFEILPVDSPAGPQFGRGGRKLMVFDVKPSIEDQAGKSSSLDFTSCTYLQNPSDETTAGCIDHLSDTGWTVPHLPADAVAHELVLRFEKPIRLLSGQRLTMTVDSGGADELAVLNRIRFAFHQTAVSKSADDQGTTALVPPATSSRDAVVTKPASRANPNEIPSRIVRVPRANGKVTTRSTDARGN